MFSRFTRLLAVCCLATAIGIAAIASAQPLAAMTLLRSELVMDGSADPPGDRIDATLFFQQGEQDATIRVRPYRIWGDHNEHAVRIKALADRNRTSDGFCEVTLEVKRPADSPQCEPQIGVPYADLDLPPGVHQIAYEIALLSKGTVVTTEATPLSRVTISDQTRHELHPQAASLPTGPVAPPAKRIVKVLILKPRTRGEGSPIVTQAVEITPTTPAAKPAPPHADTVYIAGGFERTASVVNPPTPNPAAPNPSKEPSPLANQPWTPASDVLTSEQRTVYFATNRSPQPPPDDKPRPTAAASPATSPAAAESDKPAAPVPLTNASLPFGNDPAKGLTYGSCVVNFPVQHHTKGNLETPDWWQQRDPSQFFLLEKTNTLAADAFQKTMTGPNDILVYVHGFDNSFEDAALRVAQLQYDLEFPGRAVAFSWPSQGSESVDAYQADLKQADASAAPLADLLRNLLAATAAVGGDKPPQIHIIAHSMGNRILLNAMYDLASSGAFTTRAKPFGQIILAAPDVGAVMFNNLIASTTQHAQQVTYYYSSTDMALGVSRQLNDYEPAGMFPLFEHNVRTIDADSVDTSFIGHSYFASSPLVLLDIELMLKQGLDPDHRMPPLASKSEVYGHTLWSFTAEETKEVVTQQ